MLASARLSAPAEREMPRERSKAIFVHPTTNFILTAVFLAEIFIVFYTLCTSENLPPGTPVSGPVAAAYFGTFCFSLFGVIFVIKRTSAAVGSVLSRFIFPDDPLSKPKTMHKFQDQMWQLAIHVSVGTRAL